MLVEGDIIERKYRVVRLIGEGGMGEVYEGVNTRLGKRVAIKVMHATLATERDGFIRFEREAQAAARIGSSHVPQVFDIGDLPTGERYMVMEFLEGESLATRLARVRRLSIDETARFAMQILEGLTRVHGAGIVHRDLKPGNVFVARLEDKTEVVKILDFGVCKMEKSGRSGHGVLTGVGDLLGTPSYMSPEQLEHGPARVDARSDLYSVGVLVYRAASGRLPFRGKTVLDFLAQLREGNATSFAEVVPDADPRFAAIVDKAIEWSPSSRFQSAASFRDAIGRWLGAASKVNRLLEEFLTDPTDKMARAPVQPKKSKLPPVRPPPKRRPSKAPPAPRRASYSIHDDELTLKVDTNTGARPARKRTKTGDGRSRQETIPDLEDKTIRKRK